MEFRRTLRLAATIGLGCALLLAPLATPAAAKDKEEQAAKRVPLLWEVQTTPKIYLFGTIHVADTRVTTHPPVVAKALAESQALYTELDFGSMGAELQKHILIPDGKKLDDIAPKGVIEKLDKIVARYEIPAAQAAQFKSFRPWLTAVQVPMLVSTMRKAKKAAAEAAEAGKGETAPANPAAQLPLDLQLYMGAKQAGKTVGGLEKPEEQFSIFNELSTERQVEMLSSALDELLKLDEPGKDGTGGEEAVDPIEALLRIYLAGDADGFYTLMQEEMGKTADLRAFMARLLDRRNIVMVRRMLEAGEKHPDKTMFVAVGAGHYPGPMGIVKLLRRTGFRVRRLNDVAAMEKAWPPISMPATSSRAKPASRTIRIGPFCLPRPGCR